MEYCEKVGVRPQIGMRVKLAARRGPVARQRRLPAKFGLTVGEILQGLEALKQRGMADCFKLLHFHLGSQIPNIRVVKHALNEAARMYTELHKAGAGLEYLDVGGGLGVDYDGSQTNFESSTNYTLEEYANDVVYHIQSVCDDAGVPHPTIVSESGRAVVVPLGPGLQRPGRERLWRQRRTEAAQPRRSSSRSSTSPTRSTTSRRAMGSRAITTRNRRWTWR